jgi:hypothetical protein
VRRAAAAVAGSERARQLAGAVLEVISGLETPLSVCRAIGVSVNRYYQLEAKALAAIVAAMEPLPRGRVRDERAEVEALRRAKAQAERQAARNLALYRTAQKALGLAKRPPPAGDSKPRRRRRVRPRASTLLESLKVPAPAPGSGGTP